MTYCSECQADLNALPLLCGLNGYTIKGHDIVLYKKIYIYILIYEIYIHIYENIHSMHSMAYT